HRRGPETRRRLTAGALALVALAPAAAAGEPAHLGLVTSLQGTVTVTRAGASSSVPLRFKDDIDVGDRVETGDQSNVRLLLGGKALLTLRERAAVTIADTPTVSHIELAAGAAHLNVIRE